MHRKREKPKKASREEIVRFRKNIYRFTKELVNRIKYFTGQLFILIVTHKEKREVFFGTISKSNQDLIKKNRLVNLGPLRNDYELPTVCGWVSIDNHPFDILRETLYLHMPRLLTDEKVPGRLSWHIRDLFFTKTGFTADAIHYLRLKKGPEVQLILGDFNCKKFLKNHKDQELVAKINDLLKP